MYASVVIRVRISVVAACRVGLSIAVDPSVGVAGDLCCDDRNGVVYGEVERDDGVAFVLVGLSECGCVVALGVGYAVNPGEAPACDLCVDAGVAVVYGEDERLSSLTSCVSGGSVDVCPAGVVCRPVPCVAVAYSDRVKDYIFRIVDCQI